MLSSGCVGFHAFLFLGLLILAPENNYMKASSLRCLYQKISVVCLVFLLHTELEGFEAIVSVVFYLPVLMLN